MNIPDNVFRSQIPISVSSNIGSMAKSVNTATFVPSQKGQSVQAVSMLSNLNSSKTFTDPSNGDAIKRTIMTGMRNDGNQQSSSQNFASLAGKKIAIVNSKNL